MLCCVVFLLKLLACVNGEGEVGVQGESIYEGLVCLIIDEMCVCVNSDNWL